jgi:hypothetical protein
MRSIIIHIVLEFIRTISNSLTVPPIVMRSRLQVEFMEVERMEMAVVEQLFPSPQMEWIPNLCVTLFCGVSLFAAVVF